MGSGRQHLDLGFAARQQGLRLGLLWTLVSTAALAVAGSAAAAQLSQIRVGKHDDYTRVVLELDAPTGYRLSKPRQGDSPELVLTLDASSGPKEINSTSPIVKRISASPSADGSKIRIRLASSNVQITEMMLSGPPRIVLDLRGPARVAPKPAPVAKATTAAEPTPELEALAAGASQDGATDRADGETEAAPTEDPTDAAELAASDSPDEARVLDEPATRAALAEAMAAAAPSAALAAGGAPAPKPESAEDVSAGGEELAVAADLPSDSNEALELAENVVEPAPTLHRPTSQPAEAQPARIQERTARPARSAAAKDDSLMASLMSPIGMGIVALLAVGVLGFIVMRRRRSAEEEDPLFPIMSAGDAGSEAGVSPAYVDASLGPVDEGLEVAPYGSPDEAAESMEPGPAQLPVEEESMSQDPSSIFDTPPQQVGRAMPPAAPASMAGSAGAMEGRLVELERRLESMVESSERLERQVAAQTEELRVQRAAIARTQRVVRTLSKPEDVATEPVPRD